MTRPCSVKPARRRHEGGRHGGHGGGRSMRSPLRSNLLWSILWIAAPAAGADELAGEAFFAEKVHPVLEEHCFECHGVDDTLKGDFRVTSREGLLDGGDLGPAYDEGSPAESLLLQMISYRGEDRQMPPKAKLPPEKIAVLAEWIERGAPYAPELEIKGTEEARREFTVTESDREWWAYRPVSKSDPPGVDDSDWATHGVDAFVKAQLDREGLKPNPEASPAVLVRRLHYDLVGLPPTPEEVDAFVSASRQDSEKAYAELVEELLGRPQYGEKWARHWLDLVRYAETNGFERDNPKPHIWRYRDYVVDAFNRDKPYDRFVIEQLAGDEIAEPTMESMIATGYHRLMQWDDEPADRKQHVYDVLADNVQVTSEAFLATTLGCARCHDHKADPVSQKDYYSFMAFFKGVTHYETAGTLVNWATEEEREVFEADRTRRLAELSEKRDRLSEALKRVLTDLDLFDSTGEAPENTVVDDARGKGAIWSYTTREPTDDWSEVGFLDKSWFKARGGFGTGNPPGSVVTTKWDSEVIWMRTTFGLSAVPESLILEIHHCEDVEVFLNGSRIHEAKGSTEDYEAIVLPPSATSALQTGKNVVAVRCRQSNGEGYIDLALRTRSNAAVLETLVAGSKADAISRRVEEAAGADLVGEFKDVLDEIAKRRAAEPGVPLNVVTEKGGEPGPMHIHVRGSAHAPGEVVEPGLPAVLASSDSKPRPIGAKPVAGGERTSSGRRLALAGWMVDPENPLTARVVANRLWQHHFGRGIVPSASDFGRLGEMPSHPGLLDWLAVQFVESGWSVKDMHRLLLRSRTYRMSSAPDSGSLERDPENRNFWRYPMRRLTAEELRDSILAISGNLNPKAGGPWVYPPLPEEVLATASRPDKAWPVSQDADEHFRRSLYVHAKRSLRHQMLADFDQADTDSACAVRFATTVPTQALTMLNSRFVNDQAAVFARRFRSGGDDLRSRIAFGWKLALQREATDEELDRLEILHRSLREGSDLEPDEALERIALLTLNLNEFMYLD
ncbi:MAG: PSD1 and planctomycete cytochrome C domain-containing protein [Verrucomicrobiales bacterium]